MQSQEQAEAPDDEEQLKSSKALFKFLVYVDENLTEDDVEPANDDEAAEEPSRTYWDLEQILTCLSSKVTRD